MKTQSKSVFLFLLTVFLILVACSGNEDSISKPTAPTDVYIVGITRNSSNKAIPTIWKNGIPSFLPSDTNINTTGFKIAVDGNDVYAINGNFDETDAIILWKNGVSSVIASDASAEDLIVQNGNVYILGRIGNSFRYWKNGIETILTNGLSNNFVSHMEVVNDDVYITGSENNGTKNVVKFWKNGASVNISNPNLRAFANGITVNGSEVSILYRELTESNTYTLKIWKNGVITTLKSGIHNDFSIGRGDIESNASGVFATSTLAANNEAAKIGSWNNNVKTDLTTGSTSSAPFDLEVRGNDMHIIGIERNPGTNGRSLLKYWKNGLQTVLTSDRDGNIFNPSLAISKNGNVHIAGKNKYFLNNVPTVLEGNQPEAFDIFTVN